MSKFDYVRELLRNDAMQSAQREDPQCFDVYFDDEKKDISCCSYATAYVYPRHNPKLIIPSYNSDPFMFAEARNFYQPIRLISKLGQFIIHFLLRNFRFSPGVITVYQKSFIPLHSVYYIPNDYSERKVISFCRNLDNTYEVDKAAYTRSAYRKLKNELILLSDPPPSIEHSIPKLLTVEVDNGYDRLKFSQSYERRSGAATNDAVHEFILMLSGAVREVSWPGMPEIMCDSDAYLVSEFLKHKAPNFILASFVHGDLAPWNMVFSDGKLIVFDWEDSNAEGIFLGDLFRYYTAVDRARGKMPTKGKVLELVKNAETLEIENVTIDIYAQLVAWTLCYYHENHYYRKLLRTVLDVVLEG